MKPAQQKISQEQFSEAINSVDETMTIVIPTLHLFVLISAVQLALRHPDFPDMSKKVCTDLIHQIQTRFEQESPNLSKLIGQGFDPEFDEELES